MKLGVILGHTKSSQGAVAYNGQTEYVWNGKVCDEIVIAAGKYPSLEVKIEKRDSGGVSGAAKRLKAWGAEMCLELHFNSFTSAAYGCECLVLAGDVTSTIHADLLTDALQKKYGFKERNVTRILPPSYDGDGVLEIKSGGRGYGNLKAAKDAGIKVAILLEPTFLNKKTSESEKIINDQKGYAEMIVKHFANFSGLVGGDTPITGNKATLEELVIALKNHIFHTDLQLIKPYLLAQFLLESGRGTSSLFTDYYNAGGMKFREDAMMLPGTVFATNYSAHDGKDKYAAFGSFNNFLDYYEAFISRSPYVGFEEAAERGGELYLQHIHACGYATDKDYVSKVLGLLQEAKDLLGMQYDPPKEEYSFTDMMNDISVAIKKYLSQKST